MAKGATDTVMDQLLDYVRSNCTRMFVLNAEPTTWASCNATPGAGGFKLADYTVASTDFTKGNYAGGRQLTVTAQSTATVLSTDTANHVLYATNAGATPLCWTTVTAQALTKGNNVAIPAHYIKIADPS